MYIINLLCVEVCIAGFFFIKKQEDNPCVEVDFNANRPKGGAKNGSKGKLRDYPRSFRKER